VSKPLLGRKVPNHIDMLMKQIQTHIYNINSKYHLKSASGYLRMDNIDSMWLIGFDHMEVDG
jgi:hypothetical protein